jgi:hypothetical protein
VLFEESAEFVYFFLFCCRFHYSFGVPLNCYRRRYHRILLLLGKS